jgi:hypothetical protein
MRLAAEILLTVVVAGVALLVLNGMEMLPKYLMEYLLRSGLVYQGY